MITEEILMRQNKALREENEELRETVRQLQAVASEAASLPPGVPHLTRREECVLRYLLRRHSVASRDDIYFAMYGGQGEVDIKIVDVMVHKLRRKLAQTDITIVTDWGRGYFIDRGHVAQSAVAGEVSQCIAESVAA